uniref:Uncharacterized protein n=1 Tax=Arundo donax TaxID=35708 RepID=A0A0A9HGJ1_ARUDO
MYTARRSRGSSLPPAAGEPPEGRRSQRERRRDGNRFSVTLATVAKGDEARSFRGVSLR